MNYSAQQIMHVYKNVKKEEAERLSNFNAAPIQQAYGNYYIKVEDVFSETGPEDLQYQFIGYGKINYLGNINGKTKGHLYYKNHSIKKEIETFIKVIDIIQQDQREAIDYIEKQHGRPSPQHAILYAQA